MTIRRNMTDPESIRFWQSLDEKVAVFNRTAPPWLVAPAPDRDRERAPDTDGADSSRAGRGTPPREP